MKAANPLYTPSMESDAGFAYAGCMKTLALAMGLWAAVACARAEEPGAWVTGYYPGWRQARMPPAEVDFGALTHVIHFSVVPREDGTLDSAVNMLTPANIRAAVSAAHGAGRKILVSVGGQNSRRQFLGAIGARNREAFISALAAFLAAHGYDGIDVDMEELREEDAGDYSAFILGLRARLDTLKPRPLLTAAVLWEPRLFARLAASFDQINLMTYNLAGPYPGWVAWHSGALFDADRRFPDGGSRLPSTDGLVGRFLAAGVPKRKLGIGVSFNGYVWSGAGVSSPGEAWEVAPLMKSAPYYALAETYGIKEGDPYSPGYRWDAGAQAAYLSVAGPAPEDARFVSYDNARAVRRKLEYVRSKELGGLIVWDLGAGYRPEQPAGSRDVLLQALKDARHGTRGGGR